VKCWLSCVKITTTCASFNHVQLFLSTSQHCVQQRWHSHSIDIIIIDPTRANFLRWSCTIQGFVTSNVAQTKEKNYHNQHFIDQFLPLGIEVFGCLHKQVDVFLQDCANAIWSSKGPKGLFFSILVVFLYQNIFNYVTKDASIFHFKLGNSGRLSYFPIFHPFRTHPPLPKLTYYR